MLEALLEGQRQLGSQMTEIRAALGTISENQDKLTAKQDQFTAKRDQLDARVTALTREVRNGFDDYNRKLNALNQRLLSFETWLSRIDDRLQVTAGQMQIDARSTQVGVTHQHLDGPEIRAIF